MFTYNFDDFALVNGYKDIIECTSYEDKMEFLDRIFPVGEIVDELNALKNSDIKTAKLGWDYNKSSISSYIKKNCKHIKYGQIPYEYRNYRYDCDYKPYVIIDAKVQILASRLCVNRAIEYAYNYDERFENYIKSQYDKEVVAKKELDRKNYEVINKDRIDAGHKTYKLLEIMGRTAAPYAIFEKERRYTGEKEYEIQVSSAVNNWTGNYSKNSYGELIYRDSSKVVETEQCDKISEIVLKYGKKIFVLIDEYNEEINKILGGKN